MLLYADLIPEGTTFVEGSVKIDEVEYSTGFALDELQPSASVTVKFDVTIDS